MKKITFVVSNLYKFGGVQKVTSIIANGLTRNSKYTIEIVSLFKTGNELAVNLDNKINVKYIMNGQFHFKKKYFKILKEVRKFFKVNNSDIVIVSGVGMMTLFYPALLGVKMKKMVWDHQAFNFGKLFGFEWIGKRISAKLCDALVVITETSLFEYKKNIKCRNIIKIYNPSEGDKNIKEQYNGNSKKIISCGRLENQKGFDMLVDVAKIVFEKHGNWEWHIWGNGSQKEFLQQKIDKCGLNKNIKLCGYSSNIKDIYSNYSIYVMTSRHEGLPMSLIEAQYNEIPIVSFNCETGPREIIENNINGFLIKCFDIEGMSNKIIKLIENEKLRIDFSRNSAISLEKFDLKNIEREWTKIFEEVLNGN